MTSRIKLLNLMFLGLLIAGSATAQIIPPRPPRTVDTNRPDPATQRWYDEIKKRENMPTGIGAVNNKNVVAAAVAEIYEQARKKMAPTADEKRLYADFLKQTGTGIVRIAGTVKCKHIVDITLPDQECYNQYIPGGALAFSFRRSAYTHPAYADLRRVNDHFVLPGTYVLGLITLVGDVPIESVTQDNLFVSGLTSFVPATEINEVASQDYDLSKGVKIGDLTYRKSVAIREHTTYLMRSVAYRAKFLNLPKANSKRGSLDTDERVDVTVAFRIVLKSADDTYLVLWKELARRESPLLTVDVAKR